MVKYPRHARDLSSDCDRKTVGSMLANRRYRLEETRYRKDKGLVRVFMFDPWAEPMMVQIGEYQDGDQPDWDAVYDAAMHIHEERKISRNRYGD